MLQSVVLHEIKPCRSFPDLCITCRQKLFVNVRFQPSFKILAKFRLTIHKSQCIAYNWKSTFGVGKKRGRLVSCAPVKHLISNYSGLRRVEGTRPRCSYISVSVEVFIDWQYSAKWLNKVYVLITIYLTDVKKLVTCA